MPHRGYIITPASKRQERTLLPHRRGRSRRSGAHRCCDVTRREAAFLATPGPQGPRRPRPLRSRRPSRPLPGRSGSSRQLSAPASSLVPRSPAGPYAAPVRGLRSPRGSRRRGSIQAGRRRTSTVTAAARGVAPRSLALPRLGRPTPGWPSSLRSCGPYAGRPRLAPLAPSGDRLPLRSSRPLRSLFSPPLPRTTTRDYPTTSTPHPSAKTEEDAEAIGGACTPAKAAPIGPWPRCARSSRSHHAREPRARARSARR